MSIIKPIAQLLGYILDILFMGLNAIGIGNIAIAIIIFTLLVKMLMLPLQIKQQKMTKLQSVMNPEIKAIQEKYKGKNSDTVAMQKMQAETKAVYEKYGVSQWGSCVQLLIQMPILFALYRVFQQIPLYISQIKVLFLNILGKVWLREIEVLSKLIKCYIRIMVLDEVEDIDNALLPALFHISILGKLVDCCHKC